MEEYGPDSPLPPGESVRRELVCSKPQVLGEPGASLPRSRAVPASRPGWTWNQAGDLLVLTPLIAVLQTLPSDAKGMSYPPRGSLRRQCPLEVGSWEKSKTGLGTLGTLCNLLKVI